MRAYIMRDEGLEVVRPSKPRKYCSCKGGVTDAPDDFIRHRFSADAPDEVWLTDMTEFALPGGAKVYLHPIIRSDRGVNHCISSRIGLFGEAGLVVSMSRKRCCADNSACEGSFGRLKTEFYYGRDWRGVGASEFMERLDSCLRYYFERCIVLVFFGGVGAIL